MDSQKVNVLHKLGILCRLKNLKISSRSHSVALHMHFEVTYAACLYYKVMFNPNFHARLLSQEKKFAYSLR